MWRGAFCLRRVSTSANLRRRAQSRHAVVEFELHAVLDHEDFGFFRPHGAGTPPHDAPPATPPTMKDFMFLLSVKAVYGAVKEVESGQDCA